MTNYGIEHYAFYAIDGANEVQIYKREVQLSKLIQNLECTPKENRFLRYGVSNEEKVCSILTVLFPYEVKRHSNNSIGIVDGFAYGFDYHKDIQATLKGVLKELSQKCEADLRGEVFVDTSPYIDREVAFYAGLGVYGKNGFLIHPVLGTRFFIGYIAFYNDEISKWVDSKQLDLSKTQYNECDGCTRCETACPVGICGGIDNDASKCIGMLTQTKRKLLASEKVAIHRQLYGCSICQQVCPSNQELIKPFFSTFKDTTIDIWTLLTMTNKAFKGAFGHMAFSWRSLWIYKRNVLINLGNCGGEEELTKLQNCNLSMGGTLENDSNLGEIYKWSISEMKKRLK